MKSLQWKRAIALGTSGIALVLAATPAMAQAVPDAPTATEQEMLQLMRAQAAQIDALQARIAKLEAERVPQPVTPAAPAPASSAGEVAELRAEVAELTASQKRGGSVRWDDGGPEFRSGDGFFTFQPTGRAAFDFSTTRGSKYAARNISGTEARDLRFGGKGTIGPLGYKIDIGFEDNSVGVNEVYFSYATKLIGRSTKFYLGQKLQNRSIDGSTSKENLPFMERNAVSSVGVPEMGYFTLGPQIEARGANWHVNVAVSGDAIGGTGRASDNFGVFGRAHWNPIKGANGFVHVGGWGWLEDQASDTDTVHQNPRMGQHFNDLLTVTATTINGTTGENAYGLELGGVFRNFYGFGEYTDNHVHATDDPDPSSHLRAYSIYGGWLITGERPGFSQRAGVWGGTDVKNPVTSGGAGAFEIAARYDNYDYSNMPKGGTANAWTLGLNWYLNDWARLMANYIHWTTNNGAGDYKGKDTGDSVGVRAQVSF